MLPTLSRLDSEVAAAEGRVLAADHRLGRVFLRWRRRWTDRLPVLAGVGLGSWLLRALLRPRSGAARTGRAAAGWLHMMRPALNYGLTRAAAALTAVAAGRAAARQTPLPLLTVTRLDLQRFAGLWYELGRLAPQVYRRAVRDVTVLYEPAADGGLRITTIARRADGRLQRSRGRARVLDPRSHAQLRISFAPLLLDLLPGVGRDFWVLDVAADYSVAVLGTADRRQLMLLARTPRLPVAVIRDFLQRAEAQGYPIGDLVFHVHEAAPTADATAAASA